MIHISLGNSRTNQTPKQKTGRNNENQNKFNEIETNKQTKINETKSRFFEKISKIGKLLTKLLTRKRGNAFLS